MREFRLFSTANVVGSPHGGPNPISAGMGGPTNPPTIRTMDNLILRSMMAIISVGRVPDQGSTLMNGIGGPLFPPPSLIIPWNGLATIHIKVGAIGQWRAALLPLG